MDFKPDNPLLRIKLNFADLCNLSAIKGSETVRSEHFPILTGVEAVREKSASSNSPQIASRYNLVLPGSGFLRISVKVEEPAPSITQETLEKYGGAIRVNAEGFSSGVFEVDGGGARPYFKAARITPVNNK